MYFALFDGKPRWATHRIDSQVKHEDIDENGNTIESLIDVTRYAFNSEEKERIIREYEGNCTVTELEQPTPEILERAKVLEGKTLSKTEFEKMLFNPTEEERQQEKIEVLEQSIAELSILFASTMQG